MTRDEAMRRIGYGPAWVEAGVLDDARLAEQATRADRESPEHLRYEMWRKHADRTWWHALPTDRLRALLAIDRDDATRRPSCLNAIAFDLARDTRLTRAQIDVLSAHPVVSRSAFERVLLERAIALDGSGLQLPERPRSMEVRRWTRAGTPPSEIVRRLGSSSPLEAILELASAWLAPTRDLIAAGDLVSGRVDASVADAALERAREEGRAQWSFGLRVADAVEADVVDRDLAELARARGAVSILWLIRVCGLGIGEAKHATGRFLAMGEELFVPGAVSRVLAEVRAARASPKRPDL